MIHNVLDYFRPGAGENISTAASRAIAEAGDGDAVYFPFVESSADWTYTAPAGGWPIGGKSVTVYGDGPGTTSGSSLGTVLHAAGDGLSPVFAIAPSAANVRIRDLQIAGTGSGSAAAIICPAPGSGPATSTGIILERLLITSAGGDGIHLEGGSPDTARVSRIIIRDCVVRGCHGAGISLINAFDVFLCGVSCESNYLSGLSVSDGSIEAIDCDFSGNPASSSAGVDDGGVKLLNCESAKLQACRMSEFTNGAAKAGCVINGGMAIVGMNYFTNGALTTGVKGIVVEGSSTGPVVILGNRFKNVPTLVNVTPNGPRDTIVFPQFDESSVSTPISLPQPNQGMFGAPHVARPDGSILLAGTIVPSGTSDPTFGLREGMVFYNTTLKKLRVYNGSQWKSVVSHL